ncbi:MAG: adenine nucleotide alpha hydrolase [Actinobacteria bacterium]|nr:adenine nucleotide alpha hydrolase [Actinomycetota bacterium]
MTLPADATAVHDGCLRVGDHETRHQEGALVTDRQAPVPTPLALSWSGGKDSAFALHELRDRHGVEPRALVTTVTEEYERVSMHGVRGQLLERQSAAAGVPLVRVGIPPHCTNDVYEARMAQALASTTLRGVGAVAFGDLFLQDIRAYRERQLAAAGKTAAFPLWGRDTTRLARAVIDAGFRAVVVCVDPERLDPSFAGRSYDGRFLADLPPDVDPCGENGEFHTFVFDGPVFRRRIRCRVGEVTARGGFVFCDLLPGSPKGGSERGGASRRIED